MSINDDLGKRMKEYYETVSKTKLTRRTPVAIRLDGRSFHTFTRGFKKPFDEILIKSMQETAKYLCENIQGCVLAYTQSDEITLILVDYQTLESSAWFDYQVQKMCSISASMATMKFNKVFSELVQEWSYDYYESCNHTEEDDKYEDTLLGAIERGAMFDARVFNIPKEEVTNLIYWRQLDATRNSIQMVGQANFSHNELHGKCCNEIQDMLFTQKGINWNDYPTYMKRGTCVVKKFVETRDEFDTPVVRKKWVIDLDIPIFKEEGRKYIDKLIEF